MAEPGQTSPIRSLNAVTELLADSGEFLRLFRRARTWAVSYGMWTGVVGCFVLGGYPAGRTVASAAVLLGPVPLVLLLTRRKEGEDWERYVGNLLLWTVAGQNLLAAAVTGGLHSPHAFALFMTFSSLYVRHGDTSTGQAVLALFLGGVLGMALAPRSWVGPTLVDPWLTIASALAMAGTFVVHTQLVGALRRTADKGVRAALCARDELADQALSRARELELVGSRLSHELKNPLSAIKALVQLARRSASEPVVQRQLGVVDTEVERMSVVLQSHLGFSRPFERVQRVQVDLGELADSVLALLEGRAGAARVTLRRRGDARAAVDPQRIRGALINLVANAIEACPGGGEVEIAIEDDGLTARFAVTDTGVGMARHVAERVGTPFYTTREHGTGLGVALARTAFEQHGGSLEYRSEPGRGTTAVGSVPLRTEAADARAAVR